MEVIILSVTKIVDAEGFGHEDTFSVTYWNFGAAVVIV